MSMRPVAPDPMDAQETVDTCAMYGVSVAALICLGARALRAQREAGHADPIVGGLPFSELAQINLDKPAVIAAKAGRDAGYGALCKALPKDHPWASPDFTFDADTIQRLVSEV
ncbi:MAG: hypothetical protein AAGC81_19135 [Pseudomonadota bacterium]